MASGLVESFLETFQNLTEMDRRQKKDEQDAAQTAVDQELRRYQLKQKDESQRQIDEYRDRSLSQRDELNTIRSDRAAEQVRHNLELEEARGKEQQRREARDAAVGDKERRANFARNRALGADNRTALDLSGFTEDERDAEINKLLAGERAKMPGVQAGAIGQAMAQAMTGTGGVSAPAMPTYESVATEQSPAYKLAEAQKRVQMARLQMLTEHTQELLPLKKAAVEAQTKASVARALSSAEGVKRSIANRVLAEQKFKFDKWFKGERLNIDHFNAETNRWRAQITDAGEYHRVVTDAKNLEVVMRQYEQNATRAERDIQDEIDKVEGARNYAAGAAKNIWEFKKKHPGDTSMDGALMQSEATLEQYTEPYIKRLYAERDDAKAQRVEANDALKKAQSFYMKPMTERGTVDRKQLPGFAPRGTKQLLPTNPASISPVNGLSTRKVEKPTSLPKGVPQGYILRDGPKGYGYYKP